MDFSRRTFLKATELGTLGLALSGLGFDLPKVRAAAVERCGIGGASVARIAATSTWKKFTSSNSTASKRFAWTCTTSAARI